MLDSITSSCERIDTYSVYFDTVDFRKVCLILQYPATKDAIIYNLVMLNRTFNECGNLTYKSYCDIEDTIRHFKKMKEELKFDMPYLYQTPLTPKDCINPLILLL